jgi:hypothetical protein
MTERKYVSFATENARVELGGGVQLLQVTRQYGYEGEQLSSYESYDVDGLEGSDVEQLAQLAVALKNLPEDGVFDMDYDTLLDFMMEWASDTAEGAELPFTFTDRFGDSQTYTPAAMWEASGGCEWEESAQYGSDYGWNI